MGQYGTSKRIYSKYIDSASTNIPTTFGSGSTSKVITGIGGQGYTHLKVFNDTGSRIALCITDADAAVPSSSNSTNTSQDYIASTSTEFKDDIAVYDTIYIRSDSGSSITSGIVVIEVWG
jgi:hypothetical protein